jgi:hypothetical protein
MGNELILDYFKPVLFSNTVADPLYFFNSQSQEIDWSKLRNLSSHLRQNQFECNWIKYCIKFHHPLLLHQLYAWLSLYANYFISDAIIGIDLRLYPRLRFGRLLELIISSIIEIIDAFDFAFNFDYLEFESNYPKLFQRRMLSIFDQILLVEEDFFMLRIFNRINRHFCSDLRNVIHLLQFVRYFNGNANTSSVSVSVNKEEEEEVNIWHYSGYSGSDIIY